MSEQEKYYIDCEFDGHGGTLLSMAIVHESGESLYIRTYETARSEWVIENIVPKLDLLVQGPTVHVPPNEVGYYIRTFIPETSSPIIIADSPVDIGRFCAAISTGEDGGWASAEYPSMRFEVHNVNCYPSPLEGAVQHNAWWDAMSLRAALSAR